MTASEADSTFEQLLESIYEGPFEPSPWSSFLEVFSSAMNASTVGIILWRPAHADQGFILLETVGQNWETEGENWETAGPVESSIRYLALDPFIDLPTGKPVTFDELVPDTKQLLESEFYAQYMQPMGIRYALGVDIHGPTGLEFRLRAARSTEASDFLFPEKSLCERLVPHIRRSIQIFEKMRKLESRHAVYEGVINQITTGMLLLDKSGQVLQINHAAEKLLMDESSLRVVDGQLKLKDEEGCQELRSLIHNACETQEQRTPAVTAALRIGNDDDTSSPISLLIRPIPQSTQIADGHPVVTVFITKPEETHDIPPEIVQKFFGLTKTESIVTCLIAQGISVEEIAKRQGTSVYTVRTHVRSVFKKTGVSKQTELVRRVLESLPSLR